MQNIPAATQIEALLREHGINVRVVGSIITGHMVAYVAPDFFPSSMEATRLATHIELKLGLKRATAKYQQESDRYLFRFQTGPVL